MSEEQKDYVSLGRENKYQSYLFDRKIITKINGLNSQQSQLIEQINSVTSHISSGIAHNVTSQIVGVDDAQTLKNKSFSALNDGVVTPVAYLIYNKYTNVNYGAEIAYAQTTIPSGQYDVGNIIKVECASTASGVVNVYNYVYLYINDVNVIAMPFMNAYSNMSFSVIIKQIGSSGIIFSCDYGNDTDVNLSSDMILKVSFVSFSETYTAKYCSIYLIK